MVLPTEVENVYVMPVAWVSVVSEKNFVGVYMLVLILLKYSPVRIGEIELVPS